jgi:tetratricopeptide (TPR) repeat protein
MGKDIEAEEELTNITKLVKANFEKDDLYYNELYTMYGQLANYRKDYPKALKYFKDALKVAEDNNNLDSAGSIATYIATTLIKMGRRDEVEEYAKKYALQVKEIEKRLASDQPDAANSSI